MMTQQQYELLHKELNEQQWRLYLGTEALKIGYGGISQASGTPSSNLKTLPHSRTKLRHMVYTGVHLRLSHQESERRLLLQSAANELSQMRARDSRWCDFLSNVCDIAL